MRVMERLWFMLAVCLITIALAARWQHERGWTGPGDALFVLLLPLLMIPAIGLWVLLVLADMRFPEARR